MSIKNIPLRIFTAEMDLKNLQDNKEKIVDKIGKNKYNSLEEKLILYIKGKNEGCKNRN